LIRQAPWLVGSLGTMTLDSVIISQIFFYSKKQKLFVVDENLLENGLLNDDVDDFIYS